MQCWCIRRSSRYVHDDVIKWKHFPRYWPFVRGIHRSTVNSPHKGQWRGALKFSLICVWIHSRINNREAGDLRRYRAHYDVNVMLFLCGCYIRLELPQKPSLVLYDRRRTDVMTSHWYQTLEPLHWRHNGRDGVSNHQTQDCLLKHLLRRRSKKTSKLRVTGLCAGN